MSDFKPTHKIIWNGQTEKVMYSEGDHDDCDAHGSDALCGSFFTKAEWESETGADWTITPETGLVFQGQVPIGEFSFHKLKGG